MIYLIENYAVYRIFMFIHIESLTQKSFDTLDGVLHYFRHIFFYNFTVVELF